MSQPKRPAAAESKISAASIFSMVQLEQETGFTARTIRYYVTEGILPPPKGRGPAAAYNREHLWRLRMIRELKAAENLPLEKIRERLSRLTVADIEAHFTIAARPVEGRWRRAVVHPDLEINIREQDEPDYRFEQAAGKILDYARFVIEDLERG